MAVSFHFYLFFLCLYTSLPKKIIYRNKDIYLDKQNYEVYVTYLNNTYLLFLIFQPMYPLSGLMPLTPKKCVKCLASKLSISVTMQRVWDSETLLRPLVLLQPSKQRESLRRSAKGRRRESKSHV